MPLIPFPHEWATWIFIYFPLKLWEERENVLMKKEGDRDKGKIRKKNKIKRI